MLKLTTDKHEASRGLSATAELLVILYRTTVMVNKDQYKLPNRYICASAQYTQRDRSRCRVRGACPTISYIPNVLKLNVLAAESSVSMCSSSSPSINRPPLQCTAAAAAAAICPHYTIRGCTMY